MENTKCEEPRCNCFPLRNHRSLELIDSTILHNRDIIPFCLHFSDHASNHKRKFSKLENYKPVLEKILKETCHAKRESRVSFCQQRH